MATTYEVDYIIKVLNPGGVTAINNLATAINNLGPGIKVLDRLNKRLTKLNKTFNNKSWKLSLNTTQAERKLTALEARVDKLRKKLSNINANVNGKGRGTSGRNSSSSSRQFIKSGGNLYSRSSKMPSNTLLGSGMHWTKSQIPLQAFSPKELKAYNDLLRKQANLQKQYNRQLEKYRKEMNLRSNQTAQLAWDRVRQTPPAYRKNWSKNTNRLYGTTSMLSQTQSQIHAMTNGYVAAYSGTRVPAPITGRRGGGGGVPRQTLSSALAGTNQRLLPSPQLQGNGGMAVDMLKGMGIAYGVAGLGQLFSDIIEDSTEYTNTMKTVENILKTHDKAPDFDNRFAAMTKTVRQTGIQTKFKVTEVADAAKFMAMAGLDLSEINNAIRPIADIALVGDTQLGETADLITNIMTGYNLKSHQMRKTSDIMTNTFTMSNVTLPEIAESFKFSASLLSSAGIPFEEASAAIGILGDAGIKGSTAGTTLRTILSNIIAPRGDKRQKEWASTEIKIKNDDGTNRSLHDIFTDLAAKNYDTDKFYKLFDRTAAQGAVALAMHVDKWNSVIEENFMSQGLSERLADEKKNTVKGLWAQLTSSITEDGVLAFKDVEGQIKSLLKSAIDWIQTDEAKNKMNSLFKSFMDFVDIIKDATKYFYKIYDKFGGIIKFFIEVQLYAWPVVKTITALRTALLSLRALTSVIFVLRGVCLGFAALRKEMGLVGMAKALWGGFKQNIMSGGVAPILPNAPHNQPGGGVAPTAGTVIYDKHGNPIVPAGGTAPQQPPNRNPSKAAQQWNRFRKSTFGRVAGATAFTLGGGAAGYAIGNAIDEDNGGMIGSIIGSSIGAGVGGAVMQGFSGGLGAFLTNPYTAVAAAVIALGAVGVAAYKTHKDIQRANEATEEWHKSLRDLHVNSIDLTKDNGLMIANMTVFGNELLTEQQKLERSIELLKKYNDEKNGGGKITDSGPIIGTPQGRQLESALKDADRWIGKMDIFAPIFKDLGGKFVDIKGNENDEGLGYWVLEDKVFGYVGDKISGVNEELATRVALAQYGKSDAMPLVETKEKLLSQILSAPSADYIDDRIKALKETYLPATKPVYSQNLNPKSPTNWQQSEYLQSEWVQPTWSIQFNQAVQGYNDLISLKTNYEKGTLLRVNEVQSALLGPLGSLFDENTYGVIGTPKWYATIQDMQTNPEKYNLRPEDAGSLVSHTFSELVKLYNLTDDGHKGMYLDLLRRDLWYQALSEKEKEQGLPSGGYYPGEKVGMKATDATGQEYTWQQIPSPFSFGTYGWIAKNGQQYLPDTANGPLKIIGAGNTPLSLTDQYLNAIAFNSRFAPQTASNNDAGGLNKYLLQLAQQSLLNPLANPLANPLTSSLRMPLIGVRANPLTMPKENPLAMPPIGSALNNVSPAQYKAPIQVTTDKPVVQGNNYTMQNGVNSMVINQTFTQATTTGIVGMINSSLFTAFNSFKGANKLK